MFCFQAEDGKRDLVRSRGIGDVYERRVKELAEQFEDKNVAIVRRYICLLYTTDAADE